MASAIPLLFVDANHQHPWPTLDLLALLESLCPGALVLLHDIDLPLVLKGGWVVKGPRIV